MAQRLQQDRQPQPERAREPVAQVALALRADRRVDRDHQRADPGIAGTPDHVLRDGPVARAVELEPGMVAGRRRDRLQRGVRCRRQHEGDARLGRGAGEQQVGIGAEQPGEAGGCDAERAAPGPAEQAHRLVDRRHRTEIARHQADRSQHFGIQGEAMLVLDAALDEVEQDPGQGPSRGLAQILDADRAIHIHPAGVPPDPGTRQSLRIVRRAGGTGWPGKRLGHWACATSAT